MSLQGTNPLRLAFAAARSPLAPDQLVRALLRMAVATLRLRILLEDRRQARRAPGATPEAPLYCIDGYHGGVTYWDWLVLPRGGYWYEYCWALVGRTLVERALAAPSLHTVLEMDAHTFEHMAGRQPQAIRELRRAVKAGAIEIVNGTYGHPLAPTLGGEALVRHFYYGLAAIERTLGVRVDSFLSQEPMFCPQLPQVLRGFGYQRAVLRTHWAAFGTDPAQDAAVVRWQGPDGSEIPAIPRYRFTDYSILRPRDHPGLSSGGLTGADLRLWDEGQIAAFRRQAADAGIDKPLVSRMADFHVLDPARPEAPLGNAVRLARRGLRFVTVREYFDDQALSEGPTASYRLDDMPATIPWGLGGERLQKARTEAEGRLLLAERLDAIAHALGQPSKEQALDEAWKKLLLAQHHDLHVCGPWLSRAHGKSMAAVGIELARGAEGAAQGIAERALTHLASAVDTAAVEGQPLIVFNPSPWPRREYVEVALEDERAGVFADGQPLPSQMSGSGERRAGFVLDLPPLGYQVVDVRRDDGSPPAAQESTTSAEVHADGTLSLSREGKVLLDGGGYLTVWQDGRWHDSRWSEASMRLLEEGPVCRRYLVEGRLGQFPFRQWVTVYPSLPRIEVRLELDFGRGAYFGPQLGEGETDRPYYLDDARKLCVNFPSPLRRTFCDSPFLLAETEAERITGVTLLGLDDGRGKGLAFLQRGTPGYHFARREGILRNVLAWAPREWLYASDDSVTSGRSRFTALRGRHVYRYAIVPCASRLEALRASADYRLPCLVQPCPRQSGSLPPRGSFLSIEPGAVLLSAFFIQNDRTYARLWNPSGRRRRAAVRSDDASLRMWAVSLDLQDERPVDTLSLRPWGVQTVRLEGLGAPAGRMRRRR